MMRNTALILACLAGLPAVARAQSPPTGDTLRVLLTYGGHAFQEKEVTGTPVGCACGDLVLCVECGTVDQAARSLAHLRRLI